MAIIEKDGFKFYSNLNGEMSIILESNTLKECISYIKENEIKSISISGMNYKENNVDFLSEIIDIEKLSIKSPFIKSFNGLSKLKKLNELNLGDVESEINLEKNSSIERLTVVMNKNVLGLNQLKNLKELRMWKYAPKSKDLKELSSLEAIEELEIYQSPIKSLYGCGKLKKLKRLELYYMSKLEYIDEIDENVNSLKHLRIDSCKKIKNHEFVTKLINLELLAFDNCGVIPNIKFIKSLPNLKDFIFVNTNIEDGDLSPCSGLEYVGLLNKKHYSHKSEDFKKNN